MVTGGSWWFLVVSSDPGFAESTTTLFKGFLKQIQVHNGGIISVFRRLLCDNMYVQRYIEYIYINDDQTEHIYMCMGNNPLSKNLICQVFCVHICLHFRFMN